MHFSDTLGSVSCELKTFYATSGALEITLYRCNCDLYHMGTSLKEILPYFVPLG